MKLTRLKTKRMMGMISITARYAFITFCILYGLRYMFLQSPTINTIYRTRHGHA